MRSYSELAPQTCRRLTVVQLRAVCRARGWSPTGKGKDALVAFVAPRLLERAGAGPAIASLAAPWLRLLHGIALSGGTLALRQVPPFLGRAAGRGSVDVRGCLRDVAAGLLVSGVVLVEERGFEIRRGRAVPDLVLHLPPVHREQLPPFPVRTHPLGSRVREEDATTLFRGVLQAMGPGGAERETGSLVGRVAAAASLGEGPLRVGAGEASDLTTFLDCVRRVWCEGESRAQGAAWRAAFHVLGHLPEGEGVGPDALGEALGSMGCRASVPSLADFLEDGLAAGLLVRGGEASRPCYRGAPPPAEAHRAEAGWLRAVEGAVEVDPTTCPPDGLLGLASVGRSHATKRAVRIEPHPVLLGRRGDALDGIPGLGIAAEASPSWAAAAAKAEARYGTLVLHRDLLVLHVDDEGLEALLASRLGGEIRVLGAGWFALPAALAERVETMVKQEGFALRRPA